jgi:hypothetical protein
MRIAGLLALAIFFPVFTHAATPPVLSTYTLSHDTIYPTATADSGLATTTTIDTAFSEAVKVSIKIVSAGGALIKSLYTSSSVTNPAPKMWDGTNTAGAPVGNDTYTVLISATSTATGLIMNDSSKRITVASSDTSGSDPTPPDASSDPVVTTTAAPSGAPPEYLPIPTLRILTGGDRTVSSGADTAFTATVYDSKSNKRDDALVTWSFGDGMRKVGASVFHEYYDPGEYLAVVHATTPDGGEALQEVVVMVKDASIKIFSVSSRGITIANSDLRTLDLSHWRLSAGGQEFKIPDDTQILAGHTILFPSQVIELPPADSAFLLYPSGEVAAAYPPIASASPIRETQKPSSDVASYEKVQKVEPIISTNANIQAHDEAVGAPAAATELATAGAALPSAEPVPRLAGLFKSPWTLGLLGVIAMAGGAFILL